MESMVAAAVQAAAQALGSPGELVGVAPGSQPRYALFHAANSICSQKVRAVLAQHRFGYISHQLNLFEGQTYLPFYVRLRMIGCDAFGGALAAHHGGTTAAETGGCDGAVVPTLVDCSTGEIIVDSKRICLRLDAEATAQRLYPGELAAAIDAELAIVDNLPNYQMLMGRKPKGAQAAESGSDAHAAFSRRKVAWCDALIEEHADDDTLVRAYTAKRAKELSAAQELFAPEAMRAAYDTATSALQALESKLAARSGDWLFGDRLTMADLFWGIELLRMSDVGSSGWWEGGRLPQVETYAAATQALPSIRSAIIDWPGARF